MSNLQDAVEVTCTPQRFTPITYWDEHQQEMFIEIPAKIVFSICAFIFIVMCSIWLFFGISRKVFVCLISGCAVCTIIFAACIACYWYIDRNTGGKDLIGFYFDSQKDRKTHTQIQFVFR